MSSFCTRSFSSAMLTVLSFFKDQFCRAKNTGVIMTKAGV
jgi:hypothetical protein